MIREAKIQIIICDKCNKELDPLYSQLQVGAIGYIEIIIRHVRDGGDVFIKQYCYECYEQLNIPKELIII